MEFSRHEYWSALPFPTPGDLLDPGIEPGSLASPALAGRFFNHYAAWEAQKIKLPPSPPVFYYQKHILRNKSFSYLKLFPLYSLE